VFYLRHSSDWNPHRLHSEPFPPKENHNVGLLRFDDDHDHICYRFAQVQIFGGKSNVFKSLQHILRKTLNWRPVEGRPRGRPRIRWEDQIHEDIRRIGIEDWRIKIRDRKNWEKNIRAAREQGRI
jgi:hypothetical protein